MIKAQVLLIFLFLMSGCASVPLIHGRVDDGITVRMFGDGRLEKDEGEFVREFARTHIDWKR